MAGCADWARASGLAPAGTAPPWDALVLVDHPPPWPRDATDVPGLAAVAGMAGVAGVAGRVRLQLVVPPEGRVRGRRTRVRAYARREGRATVGRAEGWAAAAEVAAVAGALVEEAAATGDDAPVEVLVCAHGARDRCCGSLGTRLARGGGEVVVERTSHLGGHRFAPTAMTLPDARLWAGVDDRVLAAIVGRDGPVGAVLAHHRGSALLDTPGLQLLEQAALATVGWDWHRWWRRPAVGERGALALEARDPAGRRWGWAAAPGPDHEVVVPPCGGRGSPVTHRGPSLRALRCTPPPGVPVDTSSFPYHYD